MTARQSPKRTKRMWGVFTARGAFTCAADGSPWAFKTRGQAYDLCMSTRGETVRPVTVTWSAPNKRKAKR